MRIESFTVIELEKSIAGWKTGLAHIPIYPGALGINMENIRRVLLYASERGVGTVILPFNAPYGISPEDVTTARSNTANETIRGISIGKNHPYIKLLKHLSESYRLSIISPGLIEKRGRAFYSTTVFFGYPRKGMLLNRKLVVSKAEKLCGFLAGNVANFFEDMSLRYYVMVGEEILYPELSRIPVYGSSDVIVIAQPLSRPVNRYLEISRYIAIMSGKWVLNIGGFIPGGTSATNIVSTAIISPSGEFVEIIADPSPTLVFIPQRYLKQGVATDPPDIEDLRRFYMIIRKIHRMRSR